MRIRLLILRTAAFPALALLAACGAPGTAPGDSPAPPAPPAASGTTSPDGLTPEQIEEIYRSRTEAQRGRYTEADVRFMTDMIHHHAQAIEISRLVPDRSERSSIRTLASRIINAQQDEIALMQRWLRDRDRPVPEVHVMDDHVMVHVPGSDAHDPAAHDMHDMPGMLTPEQVERLRATDGAGFDELFLTYMIEHHQGAVTMVRTLFATDGAGQDEEVFRFASDVQVDQATEVARMERMLDTLRSPR